MSENTNYVCPRCVVVNRVPTDRVGENPICGKCKQPLFSGRPIALTDDNFEKFIGNCDVTVIVDFWAAWCGPCKMMAPQFAEAAGRLEPHVILAKLDTDSATKTAERFGIASIPTMIAFKSGKEVARRSGALSAAQIVAVGTWHCLTNVAS